MMRTTDWVEYRDGNRKMRVRAHYGLDEALARAHRQPPFFSLTCDVEEVRFGRWREYGGGANHDLVAQHFPKLATLAKWHLCDVERGPLHYFSNALYWFDAAAGRQKLRPSDPEPMEAFKKTIVYGALPVDAAFDLETRAPASLDRKVIEEWLKARLPALLEKFHEEMKKTEVL